MRTAPKPRSNRSNTLRLPTLRYPWFTRSCGSAQARPASSSEPRLTRQAQTWHLGWLFSSPLPSRIEAPRVASERDQPLILAAAAALHGAASPADADFGGR